MTITLFILAVICIGETLSLAELWGRVAMLESITYKAKGNKAK